MEVIMETVTQSLKGEGSYGCNRVFVISRVTVLGDNAVPESSPYTSLNMFHRDDDLVTQSHPCEKVKGVGLLGKGYHPKRTGLTYPHSQDNSSSLSPVLNL